MFRPLLSASIAAVLSLGLSSIPTAAVAQGGGNPTIPNAEPWVRLGLRNADGSLTDETTVNFAAGVPGNDALDIPKIDGVTPMPLYIATLAFDGTPLSLNAHGPYTEEVVLPLQLMAADADVYTLTVLDLGTLPYTTCVSLQDLETGEIIILGEDLELAVTVPAGTPPGPRYKLRVAMPTTVNVIDAACPNEMSGSAVVTGTGYGPWNITWLNYEDLPLAGQIGQEGPVAQDGLAPGSWTVVVENLDGCGTYQIPFVVNAPDALAIQSVSEPTTCAFESSDGRIGLQVTGGTAPYAFLWSTGATSQDLENVPGGTYQVSVTDVHGCSETFPGLVVQSPPPIAGAILGPGTAGRFEQVQFTSDAAPGIQRTWDFGDGTGSILAEPQHAYQHLGIFTVTLILNDGTCQTVVQHDVLVVQGSVGLAELEGDEVRAWSAGGLITIDNPLNVDLHVHIYDATGRTVHAKRVPARTSRTDVPTTSWTKGLYFLNASTPWEQWTFSLPVAE